MPYLNLQYFCQIIFSCFQPTAVLPHLLSNFNNLQLINSDDSEYF